MNFSMLYTVSMKIYWTFREEPKLILLWWICYDETLSLYGIFFIKRAGGDPDLFFIGGDKKTKKWCTLSQVLIDNWLSAAIRPVQECFVYGVTIPDEG